MERGDRVEDTRESRRQRLEAVWGALGSEVLEYLEGLKLQISGTEAWSSRAGEPRLARAPEDRTPGDPDAA